ncbi:hypothetical protein EWM64_g7901 [Hericium alpestre]|uniref:Uncharacterized protein n=1 Tax=Hericium alpestre TaxID=135208 RepID=A0A4Y9ZMU7_9AGAM|nr:hypothetical protein EWM64_g7901 [Hericium alpestre]
MCHLLLTLPYLCLPARHHPILLDLLFDIAFLVYFVMGRNSWATSIELMWLNNHMPLYEQSHSIEGKAARKAWWEQLHGDWAADFSISEPTPQELAKANGHVNVAWAVKRRKQCDQANKQVAKSMFSEETPQVRAAVEQFREQYSLPPTLVDDIDETRKEMLQAYVCASDACPVACPVADPVADRGVGFGSWLPFANGF